MSPVDEVKARVRAFDAVGLDTLLRELQPDERAVVRTWFTRAQGWFAEVESEPFRQAAREDHRAWAGSVCWMQVSCSVALCPPAEAVRMIRWRDFWDHQEPPARALATQMLCDAPTEWAARFLPAAADVRIGAEAARWGQVAIADFVGRGLVHHGLPCPYGALFLSGRLWGGVGEADRVLGQLRTDPLMPQLLNRVVAAGLAGNVAALPLVVPTLINEGLVERELLRDTCLQALTVESRVSSQRVVAGILQAMQPRGGEVDGGLEYLLGVMATRHGSVTAALLPCAVELVDSEAALLDLAMVIAGRAERGVRKSFLRALRTDLCGRVDAECLLAALDLLADGEDDAAFLTAVASTRRRLGGAVPVTSTVDGPIGLWELDPDPGPDRVGPGSGGRDHLDLAAFLNRHMSVDHLTYEEAVPQLLRCLREHPGHPGSIAKVAGRLRRDGSLSLTRFSRLLEPVFLAGGLRVLWYDAIAIADDVASTGRSQPGLAETLRVLARYAAEVPAGQGLPVHLAALAAGPGTSHVQQEARALVAALGERLETNLNHAAPTSTQTTPLRGLWEARPRAVVLARLLDPGYSIADNAIQVEWSVRLDLGDTRSHYHYVPGTTARDDARLVDHLAVAVQKAGVDACRSQVTALRKQPPRGPVARALDLWCRGSLTASTYGDVIAAIRQALPVRCEQVAFAWAAEQFVRLPTHPGTLSAPTRSSGAIDAVALVNRLLDFEGIAEVGPLDLLLSLLRLRPVPVEERDELLASLEGVRVWTDPLVTEPMTDGASFDVVPVLREWLVHGWSTFDWTPYLGLDERVLSATAAHPEVLARVRPADPSLPVPDPNHEGRPQRLRRLVDGRLPVEHVTHRFWELGLSPSRNFEINRPRAREWLAELAQHDGVLPPEEITNLACGSYNEGHLSLTRWTEVLEWLFEHGAMRMFWDAAVAVAALGCAEGRKPHGLPFLLTLLARSIHEVPHPDLPPAVHELAASDGNTKSQHAARALVAGVTER